MTLAFASATLGWIVGIVLVLGWLVYLLGTHPPAVDRIGIAKAFEAGAR